jgi:GTP-binding protein
MRSERSIRRADLCILVVDLIMGVTAQDKRIARLIQKARKPSIVVLNKWDLVRPRRGEKQSAKERIEETRSRVFFLDYAPMLITSASSGENVDQLFAMIQKVQHAARKRIGTGVLNRLMRQAFEANPPPLVKGRRLKLFYATQPRNGGSSFDKPRSDVAPPEFVLFVNDPQSMTEAYRRYLETRIRETEPYPGLPIILTLRPRAQKGFAQSRRSNARKSHK